MSIKDMQHLRYFNMNVHNRLMQEKREYFNISVQKDLQEKWKYFDMGAHKRLAREEEIFLS